MKLSYETFLEISEGKESPLMRKVFRNLVAHKVIVLEGDLPLLSDNPLSDRVATLEQRVKKLEGKTT